MFISIPWLFHYLFNATFFGLYSFASTSVLYIKGCRGGFGGGDTDIFNDEWNKFEFLLNKKFLSTEEIGKVDERIFRRLETLNRPKRKWNFRAKKKISNLSNVLDFCSLEYW